MTRPSILVSAVLAVALGLGACGENGGGEPEAGGSGGAAGSAGTSGEGGTGNAECNRICESPCTQEVLPVGTVDDCIRSCQMGFFTCIPELVDVLTCLETINCGDPPTTACLTQSAALAACL